MTTKSVWNVGKSFNVWGSLLTIKLPFRRQPRDTKKKCTKTVCVQCTTAQWAEIIYEATFLFSSTVPTPCHYNSRLVYFLPNVWRPFLSRRFFPTIQSSCMVSNSEQLVGYDGASTVSMFPWGRIRFVIIGNKTSWNHIHFKCFWTFFNTFIVAYL